jgi:arylformamidase
MEPKRTSAIFDITVPLDAASLVTWPGDPPFRLDAVSTLDDEGCLVSQLSMSAHAGTHLDFPSHVMAGGKGAGDYAASDFVLPAVVVDVPHGADAVTHDHVLGANLLPGDAVLFRTRNSAEGACRSGRWSARYVALTPEAARACVGAELRLAGIDAQSVDRPDDDLPVHRILLANGILVLEGLDLSDVPPGRYTLTCLPLRIPGCEASPVRAVLAG